MGGIGNKVITKAEHIANREDVRKAMNRTDLRPWEDDFWLAMTTKCPTSEGKHRLPTPEELWVIACLYFAGARNDVVVKKDFIRSGDNAGKIIEMTSERPYSWTALELFMSYKGISSASLGAIRSNTDGRYPEYREVVERINSIIYQQKFDFAANGIFDSRLIIRDLGLAEKVDANIKQEQPLFSDLPETAIEE